MRRIGENMKFNQVENRIKEELQNSCQMIYASDTLKQKIDTEIENQSKKESYMRKKISTKKIVVIAAVICVFATGTCFAAGKVQSLVSSSSPFNVERDFSKLDNLEEKIGYEVKAVKAFDNGYAFSNMEADDTQGLDEDNNKVATYKCLEITYEKDGEEIDLNISKGIPSEDEQTPTETREINGICVEYNLDTYKFVPEGYEMTEEDNENVLKEHYYMSEGSEDEEVEINQVSSLSWEEDGVRYSLMQFDTKLSVDELVEMASQVIASK